MTSIRRLFAIDGLFCAGCARGVERRLRTLDGVLDAGVHFVTASALVRWDPERCDPIRISAHVRAMGYRLVERHDSATIGRMLDAESRRLSLRLAVAVVFGMWTMAASTILYVDQNLSALTAWWLAVASGLFAIPVITYSAASIFLMAWRSARLRAVGLDLLVSLSNLGAIALSCATLLAGGSRVYFDAVVMLIVLLLTGRLIEVRVRRGALDAVTAMEGLTRKTAYCRRVEAELPLEDLTVGDVIEVDAGATLPMDGIVRRGQTLVDRAILTGETIAVPVTPGQRVEAGAINQQSPIALEVDRLLGDWEIDRMGGRVAIEISARGEPVRLVDRWIPVLVGLTPVAASAGAIYAYYETGSLLDAVVRALTTLFVICPCSLALAAPLVHLFAALSASRQGARIADPSALEALAKARTVVTDKTGTLTLARLTISAVGPVDPFSMEDVLTLADEAERGIDHPIAHALASSRPASAIRNERRAREARAICPNGRRIVVASSTTMEPNDLTWLDVTVDDVLAGSIGLSDALDPQAPIAVGALGRDGLDIVIASGDAPSVAQHVARKVGVPVTSVHGGLSPSDKVALIKSLPGPVVMVGDGVNDAPALAAAACGISVARAHAAAHASAGIVIEDGGVGRLPALRALARRADRLISINLTFAVSYNIVAVVAAIIGQLTPLTAVIAMASSSLFVIANSGRV